MHSNPSKIVEDKLGHDKYSLLLHDVVCRLDPPKSIALYGNWGRGKSDILRRLEEQFWKSGKAKVIWANPWQSGHSDVLTCIAAAIARNGIDRLNPQEVLGTLAKVAKVGAVLGNRVVLRPFIETFGVDVDGTMSDVREAISDVQLVEILRQTPTDIAISSVAQMIDRAYEDSPKVVVLIDDIDRCPPAWQSALIESLYFLKGIDRKIVFLCSMDKRSIFDGSITSQSISLDFGSLASKVFDYAFELPPLDTHLRVWLQSEILSKRDGSRSLVDYITQGRIDCGDPKQVAASIAAGMFCSSELSTPRVLERVLSKLHSMPLANPNPNGHACHSELAYNFFGFSIAIRERFPDVSEFVLHELPSYLRAYLSNNLSVSEKTRIFEDRITSLHSKKPREVLISMLAKSGVFFSAEPASRDAYSKNITSANEIVHGIDWASILIRESLT